MTPEERANEINNANWKCDDELLPLIVKNIREAVLAEREECAKIADAIEDSMAEEIATSIRGRTER